MIRTEVSNAGIKAAVKVLKDTQPTVLKQMKADLRNKIGPIAKQINDSIPTEPPISGLGRGRLTSWSPVKTTVSITPGSSKKKGFNLITIKVNPIGKYRGVYIAEMGGMRTTGYTPQGRAMIRNLNARRAMKGKGGRFAFDKFRTLRPDAVSLATKILKDTMQDINIRLDF